MTQRFECMLSLVGSQVVACAASSMLEQEGTAQQWTVQSLKCQPLNCFGRWVLGVAIYRHCHSI